jgi:hypothetical protein
LLEKEKELLKEEVNATKESQTGKVVLYSLSLSDAPGYAFMCNMIIVHCLFIAI